ncbi:unnamed protein product [Prunus armeniaca]
MPPPPRTKSRLGLHSSLLPYSQQGASFSSGKYRYIPRKKQGKLDNVLDVYYIDLFWYDFELNSSCAFYDDAA